ncbi:MULTISPECIES: hypothetical protein [Acinetobacter]|uniref:hypothetical protein n=1 Tax=Acinetobacter TaxID=469 RepID=UPI0002D09DB8|nr:MULTISPECIES: hypothetical protein [Acinetobacter]ENX60814.1 hypothetical protein F885_01922 [Acinetobacter higginsii]MCH7316779.1 hypothetical protein [Acinetobacter higginsii]QHH95759.1 hypothetical protein FPL18_18915 [Acinetobacter gyllenbergii]
MIDFIVKLYKAEPSTFVGMIGLLFFILLWVFFVSLYVYTNIYIKEICGIVYKDEKKFKRLMEPFDFFYLSMLPSAYWREILNLKFDTSFKALYGNNVYQRIDDSQLMELLKNYPFFFFLHYFFILSGILGTLLLFFAYFLEKYL